MDDSREEWKPVVGYECNYHVSSLGRIRNALSLNITYGAKHSKGYRIIRLKREDGKTIHYIHRLVAAAFIGPCPDRMQVNQKNGIKSDNSLSNIEYLTGAANHRHAALSGLHAQGTRKAGAKLTEESVVQVRRLASVYTRRNWRPCSMSVKQ